MPRSANCSWNVIFDGSLQSHPRRWRQKAVKQDHPDLSVRRQCSLLSLARSSLYYHPRGESAENLAFMENISFIPMRRGFFYFVAIMDWHSRKVLSWRLSNSMDAGFCVEALKEALARYGPPEIFNSDQGSQFTSTDFTDVLHDAKVKISMDGRGRWIDNRMIKRFWRSLKYECVYLNAFETGSEACEGIGAWITYYNEKRPHSSHGLLTPSEAYDSRAPNLKAAA